MTQSSTVRTPSSLMDMKAGDLMSFAVSAFYLSTVPVANYLASPTGFVGTTLSKVLEVAGIREDKKIMALGAWYFLVAYPLGAGWSVFGQTMNPARRYANKDPRGGQAELVGIGRRLVSSHQNLMEIFPAFALAAVLTQATVGPQADFVNLLALHVALKTTIYPLAYITDFDLIRSTSHMIAIGSLVSVFYKLCYA